MMKGQTHVPGAAAGLSRQMTLWVLAALLLAGASICLYLTRFHENAMYGDRSVGLANCPESETTNCEAVNTSGYSELAGIPISTLGIPTYLLLLAMVVAARRRPRLLSHVYSVPRTLVVTRDGSVLKTLYGAQPWGESSFREKIRALLQLPRSGG